MYGSNPYYPGVPQMSQNPYMQPPHTSLPKQEVIKVNGENGARAYPMGANSSALLLDESGLLIWLVTTDGAGYKTVGAYDITPHQTAPAPDFMALEQRIERLEELINGNTADSENAGTKPAGNGQNQPNKRYDPYGQDRKRSFGSDAGAGS